MITVRLELRLDEQWSAVSATLAEGIRTAVFHAVTEGADEARRVHQYKDRTGNLTKSIYGRLDSYDRHGAEGTIGARASYASFVENGTRPHRIEASNASALRWQSEDGAVHFARAVNHPGTKPHPFAGPALLKAERVLEAGIAVAVARAAEETD